MSWLIAKATIADIRRMVNVTASTVSRALNDYPAISESTKKQLVCTAKKVKVKTEPACFFARPGQDQHHRRNYSMC
jgi:hypothetical protein